MHPLFTHPAALKDLQHLQLDPVRDRCESCKIPYGIQHILTTLPGKAQDHMDDHRKTGFLQTLICFFKHIKTITTVERLCRLFMDGLQSQLHPYRLYRIQAYQHVQNIIGNTVRASPYGKSNDLRSLQNLFIHRFQLLSRPVGIRKRLKVRNVLSRALRQILWELPIHSFLRLPDLLL